MTTTVKVLNAEKVIGTHQIPKDNVLVLKAENNVNYQLVNDATGFGPQNILTKREGNNLVISLEDGDTRPDLIIEDYYSNKGATNLIVGLHENGQIYAYVPESGKVAESISVLAEEVVAPQALGGTELAVPFWSFNPWWLAGAAAVVGGVAALAAGGSSKKASVATTTAPKLQASENGDLEVLPADGNRTVTVDFLNKQGQQQVIKIERVGNEWRIVEPADTTLPNYVQFDSTTGKITIDPSEVGGDGKVNVSATEPGKIDSSQKDVTNNTQLTAEKPDVEPTGNGGKTVSPKNNTKEMSINFTNEQGQPQTVVVEKVNGVWQLKNGGTLPKGVDLNNQTGQVTLDPQLLGDSTPISVEGKEDGKVDAVVNGVTEGDANAAPPPVKALADGGIEFSPAVGNTEVYAEFFNEDNVKQTVTIVQDANGNWVLKPGTTKPEGVTINSNGVVTVDSQAIQDKSKITAIGREAGKNEAPNDATSSAIDTAPAQPKVLPKESGGIDIIPAAGNDEVAVEIPNEKGGIDPISIKKVGNDWLPVVNGDTLKKSENGNYAELPKGITVDPKTGKISVDPQAVADNAEITATATENGKNGVAQKTASTIDDKNAAQPKVEAKADGSVVATPETGNELMEVKYHSEGNTGTDPDQKVTVAKGDDGWYFALPPANPTDKPTLLFKDGDTWKVKSPDGQTTDATPEQINALPADVKDGDAKLDKATGAVTLDPQAVKDGSKVEATGKEADKDDSPALDPEVTAEEDSQAASPTITKGDANKPAKKGGVDVAPDAASVSMTTSFPSEDATGTTPDVTLKTEKVGDKWYISAGEGADKVLLFKDTDGKIKAVGADGTGTPAEATPEQLAKLNPKAKELLEEGKIELNQGTGVVSLSPQAVKDGGEVKATATEAPKADGTARKESAEAKETTDADGQAAQPKVEPKADGAVEVLPETGNTELEVKYHSEGNTATDPDKTVTVRKVGDDWLPVVNGQPLTKSPTGEYSQLPGVKVDPETGKVTLDPQAVKDGSKVEATGKEAGKADSPELDPAPKAQEDSQAASPTITKGDANDPAKKGGVDVAPDAASVSMTTSFPSEDATGTTPDVTLKTEKVGDKWYISAGEGADKVLLFKDTDGKLKAVGADGTGTPAEATKEQLDNLNSKAKELLEEGKIELNQGTGVVSLSPQAVKDGGEVKATATEAPKADGTARKESAEAKETTDADGQAAQPKVEAKADGSVVATPETGNELMEVKYHSEGNTGTDPDQKVTVAKGDDGWYFALPPANPTDKPTLLFKDGDTWKVKSPDGQTTDATPEQINALPADVKDGDAKLDKATGAVTLDPQAVKDGSKVEATGKEADKDDSPALDPEVTAEEDSQAASPTITKGDANKPAKKGGVDVAPDAASVSMTTSFPSEDATGTTPDVTLKTEKVGDKWYISAGEGADKVLLFKDTDGKIKAVGADGTGTPAEATPEQLAKLNPKAKELLEEGKIELNQGTGVVSLSPQAVKDGGEVKATATEAPKADGTARKESAEAKETTDADGQAAQPKVEPKADGAVEVLPETGNTELEVKYHSEGNTATDPDKTVTVRKVGDDWLPVVNGQPLTKSPTGEYSQLPGVKVDPETGKVTLDPQAVKDGSAVTATGKEAGKADSPELDPAPKAQEDSQAASPTITKGDANDPAKKGGVDVAPDAASVSMTTSFPSEDATGTTPDVTLKTEKVGDKWYISAGEGADKVLLFKDTDGKLKAVGADGTGTPAEATKEQLDNLNSKAKELLEEGKIELNQGTGVVSLSPQAVKDGGEVKATATEAPKADGTARKESAEAKETTDADGQAAQPKVEAKADGSVVATPETGNELMEVKYHSEGNTGTDPDQKVTVAKGDDGWYFALPPANPTDKPTLLFKDGDTWKVKSPDGQTTDATPEQINALPADVKDGDAKLDKDTGAVTLDPQAVKDGSKVEATGKEADKDDSPALDPEVTAEEDSQAASPTITKGDANKPAKKGGVDVAPDAASVSMTTSFPSEDATGTTPDVTLKTEKVGDKWYISAGEGADKVLLFKDTDGKLKAVGADGTGTPAEATKEQLDNLNSKAKELLEEGKIELNQGTGVVSLSPQAVKDGGEVKATATEAPKADGTARKESAEAKETTDADGQAAQPKVEAKADGSVVATPETGNELVEVKYHSEGNPDGEEPDQTVTIGKGDDNKWYFALPPANPTDKPTLLFRDPTDGNKLKVKGQGAEADRELTEEELMKVPADVKDGDAKLNETTGAVTLDPQAVKDGSAVTATGKEADKDDSPELDPEVTAEEDSQAASPTITKGDANKPAKKGGVDVAPDAASVSMTTSFPSEDATGTTPDVTLKTEKVGDKWYISAGEGADKVLLFKDTDGKLKAVGADGTGTPAEATKEQLDNLNSKAKELLEEGKIELNQGTGVVSLSPQAVKDGGEVKATATEAPKADGTARKESAEAKETTDADGQAAQPKVEAKADGSVVATPETGNELMEVKYHSEGNTGTDPDQKVTVAKGDDGWYFALPPANPTDKPTLLFKDGDTWKVKSPDGGQPTDATPEQINALPADVKDGEAKLDKDTGAVTLDPQAVKDGSKVEATGKETGKDDSPELDPAPVTKADGTAGAPTVVTDPTGPVSATPNMTNDLMEVKYHSEDNTGTEPNKTVTVKKVGNDWVPVVDGQTLPKSDTGVYTQLPNVKVDPVTGKVTLDKELVKDGSQVTVTVTEGRKDPVTKTDSSGYDEVPQPDIVANTDNGFDVTPKPQNVEMTASFTNERDQPQEVKIKKEGNEWFFPVEVTSNKDGATDPERALLFKNEQGQWMAKGTGEQPDKPATSAQIAALPQEVRDGNVTLDQSSGKLSIAGQAIEDGTKVSVTAKDAVGRTSTAKESDDAPNDGTAASPDITTTENGGVKVKPAANSKELEVKFHSENNPDGAQPNQTVKAVLDETTRKWKLEPGTKLPKGVTLNSTTGEIELKPHAVKDNSEVTATATEPTPTQPASVTGIAPTDTGPAGTESATEADPAKNIKPGDTVITPASDTKRIEVSYTNKAGENKKVTVTKNGNGTWSKTGDVPEDDLKFDPTDGTLVIPTAKLQGGSEVTYVTYTDTVPEDKYTRKTPAALQVEQEGSGTAKGGMKVNASKDDVRIEIEMTSEADNQYILTFTRSSDNSNDWKLEKVVKTGETAPVYIHGGNQPMPVDLQRNEITREQGRDVLTKKDMVTITGNQIEFHPNALKDDSQIRATGYNKDNVKEFERSEQNPLDYLPPGAGYYVDKGDHYAFYVVGTFWAADADKSMPVADVYRDGRIVSNEFKNSAALVVQYTDSNGTEKTQYIVRPTNTRSNNGTILGKFDSKADIYEKNLDGSWTDLGDINPGSGYNSSQFISLGSNVTAYIRKSDIRDGSLKVLMDTGFDTKEIPEFKANAIATHNIGNTDIRINGEKLLGSSSISSGSPWVKLDGSAGTKVIFETSEGSGFRELPVAQAAELQQQGYKLYTYLDTNVNQNLFVYVHNLLTHQVETL